MRTASLCTGALATTAQNAHAQQPIFRRLELRPFVGAYVPTGSHGDLLETGVTAGAQSAFAFNRYLSAVGAVGWSTSEQKTLAVDDLDIYSYDLGAELGIDRSITAALSLRPFLGLGVGGRSYDCQDRDAEAQHNVAGYAAVARSCS